MEGVWGVGGPNFSSPAPKPLCLFHHRHGVGDSVSPTNTSTTCLAGMSRRLAGSGSTRGPLVGVPVRISLSPPLGSGRRRHYRSLFFFFDTVITGLLTIAQNNNMPHVRIYIYQIERLKDNGPVHSFRYHFQPYHFLPKL